MALSSGSKLGPYEITGSLGSGGMGEVYRARDTRLERDVAIKVLPPGMSSDPSLRQRLDREAKTVSKLSHAHICTLHDIGHQDGVDYIVMELVEGETLEQRLKKGPLPPEQTLRYGAQIGSALAKAHKLGIVHRDLKPSNIMLTKNGAKLMDFGLAKGSGPAPLAAALTEMTAEQTKLTTEGTIVGTFQYMAPEQLEGKDADARTDIFALGEVIYEMATGKAAFTGKTRASLIAAILSSEPATMASLQPLTPPALERAVQKCLAKDPDERWQSARDLADELNWIAVGGQAEGASSVTGRERWQRWGWPAAAVLLLLLVASGLALWKKSTQHSPAMYFNAAVPYAANDVALSPDGKTLAAIAYSTQTNDYMIWTYDIGGRHNVAVDGTQGASFPFWSPDSKAIGFFADGKLKRVDLAGGQVQLLCDAANGRGGTWNRDGVILFSGDSLGGLSRVSAAGGSPVELTKPDPDRSESSHRWPQFLPDGNHYLFLGANFSGKPENNAVFIGSLDSQEKCLLVSSSANASYAAPGYLVYLRDRTLVAQSFDGRRCALSGEPQTLSNEVLFFPLVDRAVFAVAGDSVLVTQTGKGASLSQPTWFDRSGKQLGTVGEPAIYNNISLSPDGRHVASDQVDAGGRYIHVWTTDTHAGTTTRLTFDASLHQTPVWSPDGKQVVYSSNRTMSFDLYVKNADGSGTEQTLTGFPERTPVNAWDWSRDGRYVLIRKGIGLWYFSRADHSLKPLIQAKWTVRNAQLSPDGRWIAYTTNETGRMEAYVSQFPGLGSRWQVSNAGGQEPRWRGDGKELFYISPEGKVMAVPVTTTTMFAAGAPVALFQTHRRQPISSQDVFSYDVTRDGQKFIVSTKVDEGKAAPLTVLLNWSSGLEK